MQLIKGLLGNRYFFGILAGVFLTGYIAFLVGDNYFAQVELQGSARRNIRQDLDKRAAAVSYFFAERRYDMKNLAASRPIAIFFENKALGMSMEYGLGGSLVNIQNSFQDMLTERKLGEDPIYIRLVLIDSAGECLADSQVLHRCRPPEKNWKRFLAPASRNPVILSEETAGQTEVMLSTPFFFKDLYAGQIIAWLSWATVNKNLVSAAKEVSPQITRVFFREGDFYLQGNREAAPSWPYLPEISSLTAGEYQRFQALRPGRQPLEMIALWTPIPHTPFSMMQALPANDVHGPLSPHYHLVVLGSLSLLLLGGLAVIWRSTTNNLVLHARLDEASTKEQEIEAKNRQLQEEITERQRVEEALRQNEERLQVVLEGSNDGFWDWNVSTGVIFYSPRWAEMLGYQLDCIEPDVSSWEKLLHPEDLPVAWEVINQHLEGKTSHFEVEFRMQNLAGDWQWILGRGKVVARDEQSKPLRVAGVHTDITALKKAETLIKTSLQEKEVLLKEIHHRVKNNLQIISSLLYLQSHNIKDTAVLSLFQDCRNRIRSMSLVHEALYRSGDLAKINLKDYLSNLSKELLRSYLDLNVNISLQLEIDNVTLGIDTAIPCGLVISELLSNSLKYAFPDNRTGTIVLSLHLQNDNEFELIVSDNGIGLPKDFDITKSSSLGLSLAFDIVERQLAGRITLTPAPGTKYCIYFKELKYPKRI
jgi:PAS domain S-box-containing protein